MIFHTITHQGQWQPLQPGLQYETLNLSQIHPGLILHAFKIDLKNYRLVIARAKDLNQKAVFAQQINEQIDGLITINGGFFTPEMKPLGLRISNYQLVNPAKNVAWWATFLIQNNMPVITRKLNIVNMQKISFAIQAGPRLLIDGALPKLNSLKIAERSALGITRDNKVIIAITNNVGATNFQMAKIMQNRLHCVNALNLDGGSSSQLFAKIKSFKLSIGSFRPVVDAITVISKGF